MLSRQRITLYLVAPLCAAPLCALAFFLSLYGVDVPFWDEWDTLYLFDNYYQGKLSFQDLWRQHNEHRIFFPKLLFLLLGIPSSFNVVWEMWGSALLALGSYLLLLRIVLQARFPEREYAARAGLCVGLAWLLFSLAQYENFFWGFQIQWLLTNFAVISGYFFASRERLDSPTLCATALCGALALLSSAGGFAYWIVLSGFLLLTRSLPRDRRLWTFAGWTMFAALLLLAYFHGFIRTKSMPSLLDALQAPGPRLRYALAYLASPLLWGKTPPWAPTALGLLGVAAFAGASAASWRRDAPGASRARRFFLLLGCYAAVSALLTGIGRSGFGEAQAMSSRYTSTSLLFWTALLFFLVENGRGRTASPRRAALSALAAAGLVFCVSLRGVAALPPIAGHANQLSQARALLLSQPEMVPKKTLETLFPDSERLLRQDLPLLRRRKLSFYRDVDFLPHHPAPQDNSSPRLLRDWRSQGGVLR
jgi:hypothetical protein